MKSNRRAFLKSTAAAGACLAGARLLNGASASHSSGELLYNGIRLPAVWPPNSNEALSRVPRMPFYLQSPPPIIPIDVGRQLFVDDFLIQKTNLRRRFHYPEKYAGNPVLRPETSLELNNGARPCAAVFNDGVWFDAQDRLFKMWYHAGWFDGTALATSRDGLNWDRPALDIVPGTNRVLPPHGKARRDGCSVWLDPHTSDNPSRPNPLKIQFPTNNPPPPVTLKVCHLPALTRSQPVNSNP
jgi:hypothetical protein